MDYHMRRSDRRIADPAEIRAILEEGRFVTVAFAGDEPYLVTLSYGLHESGRRLYFHVAHEGRKLDRIAVDPRVCATVVLEQGYAQGECEHPFRSVVMRGRMRVVDEADEKRLAIETLVRHLEDDPEEYWRSRAWRLDQRIDGFTALALEIDALDAKQGR